MTYSEPLGSTQSCWLAWAHFYVGAGSTAPDLIRFGVLEIDTQACRASVGSVAVPLRRMEYALLAHLARHPHRVYTQDELMRDVWGYRSAGATRTLHSHASRLRRALARAGAEGLIPQRAEHRLPPRPRRPQRAGPRKATSECGRVLPIIARCACIGIGPRPASQRAGAPEGE